MLFTHRFHCATGAINILIDKLRTVVLKIGYNKTDVSARRGVLGLDYDPSVSSISNIIANGALL